MVKTSELSERKKEAIIQLHVQQLHENIQQHLNEWDRELLKPETAHLYSVIQDLYSWEVHTTDDLVLSVRERLLTKCSWTNRGRVVVATRVHLLNVQGFYRIDVNVTLVEEKNTITVGATIMANGEYTEHEIEPDALVADLLRRVAGELHCQQEDLKGIFYGRFMQRYKTLREHGVRDKTSIHVVATHGGFEEHKFWSFHIPSVSDALLGNPNRVIQKQRPTITVTLQHTDRYPLPEYVTKGNRTLDSHDRWDKYVNFSDFWSMRRYDEGVMLVRLREEFTQDTQSLTDIDERLDRCRYNVLKNNKTYYGGDTRSWQRYTREKPVKISSLKITPTSLSFQVEKDLIDGAHYAVLFLHATFTRHDVIHVRPKGDDYLIPFLVNIEKKHEQPRKRKHEESDMPESHECVVCMENQKEYVCVPCGHRAMCEQCAHSIQEAYPRCPMCRADITQVIKVYD